MLYKTSVAIATILILGGCAESTTTTLQKDRAFVVYFYADWCGPCQKMRTNWESRAVKTVLSSFKGRNVYKVNVDREPGFTAKYGVGPIPCTIVMDEKGKEIRRHTGYMDVGEIVEFLE